MHSRWLVTVCFAPLVAACGTPSAPTPPPDVRGSWGGTAAAWSWTDTYMFASDVSRRLTCEGTLDVTHQDGASFGGRYRIACTESSSGEIVDGRIGPDGRLVFRLRADEGWEPAIPPAWFNQPCLRVPDGGEYEGTVAGGSLSVTRTQDVQCPPGRVLVTSAFRGARSQP